MNLIEELIGLFKTTDWGKTRECVIKVANNKNVQTAANNAVKVANNNKFQTATDKVLKFAKNKNVQTAVKGVAGAAVLIAAEEGTRRGIEKLSRPDLEKKLKKIDRLQLKGTITEEEHNILRQKLIENTAPADI